MPGVALALPQIAPRPKPAPAPIPKALTPHLVLPAAVASLHLALPAVEEGQELEVVIQVRAGGKVLIEEGLHRPVPSVGGILKVNVDIRRG